MANAAVTITGTPENPILNFTVPQGEKGDPGGFNIGTDLGTSNLNTVITPGLYFQGNGNNTTVANNYPKTQPSRATLRVYPVGANVIEQLIEFVPTSAAPFNANRSIYIRSIISGTPNSWVAFNSTRVDQTAGRAIYQWDDLNNREQLVYGDTGWRDVTAGVTAPFTASQLRMRRIGQEVRFVFSTLKKTDTAPSGEPFYSLPVGFQVDIQGGYYYNLGYLSTSPNAPGAIAGYGVYAGQTVCQKLISSGAWANSQYFSGEMNFTTKDAWPTVLPGTAIGTIPNL